MTSLARLRPRVAAQARFRCGYCQTQEVVICRSTLIFVYMHAQSGLKLVITLQSPDGLHFPQAQTY